MIEAISLFSPGNACSRQCLYIYPSVVPSRKPCKHSHDLRCPHNQSLLRDCTLQDLPEEDLFLLLMQNDPSLLPEVRGARADGQSAMVNSIYLNTQKRVVTKLAYVHLDQTSSS